MMIPALPTMDHDIVYHTPPKPIFIPKKHTKMNYATQNRIAKRRKKLKKYGSS